MNEKQLRRILNKSEMLSKKIENYLKRKILVKQEVDSKEINGHIAKSEHNAEFVKDTGAFNLIHPFVFFFICNFLIATSPSLSFFR